MKNIYIGYSDFTNTLYAFSKKDYSDKQDVSEQFVNIVRKVCKLNDSKEIKIGDLVLQIKEEDLQIHCPDVLCEDCTKEDCNIKKLGLVPNKEIKENDRK